MIKLQDLTPEVYYKQSRDFQYLGRLYDTVLNAIKTNTDMIYDIPASDAAGSKMIDLLALTLGFKSRHNYSVNQLAAICSIFPLILRYKGTEYAIDMVVRALLSVEGIIKKYSITQDLDDKYKWYIIVPLELKDLNLLKDLLTYIIPAGISCEVSRATTEELTAAKTVLYANDSILFDKKHILPAGEIANADDINAIAIDTDSTKPDGYGIAVDPNADPYVGKYVNGLTINSTVFSGKKEENDE